MKLSLACIAGNVESLIDRFLDVFQPTCDEVVVVRAIGAAKPDRTMEICQARGCVTAEYINQLRPEWEHVDDFAAARNAAFDMATGDLIFWADTDDVLENNPPPELLRTILEKMPPECKGLMAPYIVPGDGLEVMRERVIRKGTARWVHRVHECLNFGEEKPLLGKTQQIKWLHAPGECRKVNDGRNLRIIQDMDKATLSMSHRFHLFQSLRACGKIDEACDVARETVQMPECGPNEKYELLISLGQESKDPNTRSQLYLQAVAADPARREGYGELCLASIMDNKPDDAVGWARAMIAQQKPREWQWNSRRKYYGYLGEHIRCMALRAAGRSDEADTREINEFIRAGAKISLLHATYGRPAKAYQTKVAWYDRADNPQAIEHIFAIDNDDESSRALALSRCVRNTVSGCVNAWNAAAHASRGQVLVQLSDDWLPPRGWDTMILEAIGDTSKPAVLAINDGGRRDDLLCMAILTRKRWEDQGCLMFSPEFWSVYSDNWFTDCAYRDGVVIDARDRITFEHQHPAFGKASIDPTYQRQNSQFAYVAGAKVYDRLKRGVLTASNTEGWFNFADVYWMIADHIPQGAKFAEIGTWMGQSLIYLCQRIQDREKQGITIYAVDTWRGELNQPEHVGIVAQHGGSIRHVFEDNIAKAEVADMVELIEGDSAESAASFENSELFGCFIDAAHDYESVRKDLAAWYPKVMTGGIFAGHDYQWHEVRRAVDEFIEAAGLKLTAAGNCWIVQKPR